MKNNFFAVWLTGLPGAGKSVIAKALQTQLHEKGIESQILKTDELRSYITPEPKYTDEERQMVYNAFSYIAKLLVENGINVIMDATGNRRKYRALAREIIPNYYEVYLKCPLKVAMKREMKRADTKGAPENIYKKALEGKADNVPGIQAEYEEPKEPDLIIKTDKKGIDESAKKISSFLT
ncbi:MAG: putative adenylyl-sulfate kinase [Promethearchaeota archaeon]|nr:MAG: putative adenylyl-sulfate kinase [Candidatus Lokiarchaeota archaeon]